MNGKMSRERERGRKEKEQAGEQAVENEVQGGA